MQDDTRDDIKEIKGDVREIKSIVTELQKSDAIQAVILREHERRSTTLEEQFKATLPPIQTHVALVQKLLYFAGAVALAIITQYLIKLI